MKIKLFLLGKDQESSRFLTLNLVRLFVVIVDPIDHNQITVIEDEIDELEQNEVICF